eukprot:g8665.t1
MGCGESKSSEAALSAIDLELAEAAKAAKWNAKILLLGAGESGKSTFAKQLTLITKGTLTDGEMMLYRRAIRQNLVECMRSLLNAGESMGIPLANPKLRTAAQRVQELDLVLGDVTPETGRDVRELWEDAGVQRVWANKAKYWILDSTPYYMREALRVTQDSFDITEEDVVMTRVITSGVGSTVVMDPPMKYTLVDVGGQRNERKKWLHCFDDVKTIVFLISLAGYNQVMFEDVRQNRLLEALDLYEQVVGNPIFRETPIHVLLNKMDLFEEMIRETPLTACFPEYSGPPGEVTPAIKFIEGKVRSIMAKCCPNKSKGVVITPICARLRTDVQLGWKVVTDTVRASYGDGDGDEEERIERHKVHE